MDENPAQNHTKVMVKKQNVVMKTDLAKTIYFTKSDSSKNDDFIGPEKYREIKKLSNNLS